MRRIATSVAAVIAASLVLAGCASTEQQPRGPQGPNGYTLSADLGEGQSLWWDRSPQSGLSDLIVIDTDDSFIGSCLGMPGELCFIGPEDARIALLIAAPTVVRSVIHLYGQDSELIPGDGPGADEPTVFAVRLPADRPDPEAGLSIELFDASGQPVPLQ